MQLLEQAARALDLVANLKRFRHTDFTMIAPDPIRKRQIFSTQRIVSRLAFQDINGVG